MAEGADTPRYLVKALSLHGGVFHLVPRLGPEQDKACRLRHRGPGEQRPRQHQTTPRIMDGTHPDLEASKTGLPFSSNYKVYMKDPTRRLACS